MAISSPKSSSALAGNPHPANPTEPSMLRRSALLSLMLLLPLSACMPDAALDTDAQKVSYGKGLEAGRSVNDMGDSLHLAAFMAGLMDGVDEAAPKVPAGELEAAKTRFYGAEGESEQGMDESGREGEPPDSSEEAAGMSPDTLESGA